jgi:hypothetical protein
VDPVVALEPVFGSWGALFTALATGGVIGGVIGLTNDHQGPELARDFGGGVFVTALVAIGAGLAGIAL